MKTKDRSQLPLLTLSANPPSPLAGPDSLYIRAMLEVKGIGNQTLHRLIQLAGGVSALWQAESVWLSQYLSKEKSRAFSQRQKEGVKTDWLECYEQLGIRVLAITDAAYPSQLREIHNAPTLLYVRGESSLLSGFSVAVVGTRRMSEYGRQATDKLVSELKPASTVIVSGLAAGVDTCAHWAALRTGLPTVAVFGCGLDVIAPVSNRKLAEAILSGGGALVSEYPLGVMPDKTTFPQRNRIVAGLSQGVLVVEGDVKSGALITARLAVDEGRTVYAVPGNLFSLGSQGPHYLIKNGAIPVTEGAEILADLAWQGGDYPLKQENLAPQSVGTPSPVIPEGLSDDEVLVLQSISFDAAVIEDLPKATGLPSVKINELLTLLELEGLIVLLPGAKVCRK